MREEEIAAGLAAVHERIGAACAAAGRDPGEVTLVVVTKTYPASDVQVLAKLGVTDVGENRDQEAAPKAEEVAALGAQVRWHFVGQLQRNKCRSVVGYADAVHSIDGVRLARALAGAAQRHRERPLDVLVQVSIDGDPARGGAVVGATVDPDRDFDRVALTVAEAAPLRLAGVMAVAPLHWSPEAAFERLTEVSARLRAAHPEATAVSAGMSADLEAAIGYGATHVRIGSAVLGTRPKLR
ncbi:YggS family pyridoxal phosphate-dependent enzyme [Phytohabitans sp. ZYX-F-186]|uniref:Pyridoxal phosphate homeostasis protein n=1 Tax=Phytohabitans maris TaxID=3071409 RepID=A0ABU0ZBV3_9ACTN|nr:YggS family pyridoxal phosphate-dependent enzyme [Phytohabitans sp. ZYX-F-186]MDQ7904527.1 YggS family pyridoxal phosphate-dependent enzyme [Phytohabitans sp. ZYX-F-186]